MPKPDWCSIFKKKLDEEEGGGLRALAEVLMSYGERHFDGSSSQRRQGMWANVLVMCGQFERVRSYPFMDLLDTNTRSSRPSPLLTST